MALGRRLAESQPIPKSEAILCMIQTEHPAGSENVMRHHSWLFGADESMKYTHRTSLEALSEEDRSTVFDFLLLGETKIFEPQNWTT
jgi:hypothetical protein